MKNAVADIMQFESHRIIGLLQKVLMALVILIFSAGCKTNANSVYGKCEKIITGSGPEDFVVSVDSGNIFISSHERRHWDVQGEIYIFNTSNGKISVMPRTGEPEGLYFAPHGMDINRNSNILYVISHGRERNDNDHRILAYHIMGNKLVFFGQVSNDSLIVSPNDLAVTPEGNLYITNDAGERGSVLELLTGKKRSSVVYCEIQEKTAGNIWGKCRIAAEGLGMANGVISDNNDYIYVSATRENNLYRYKRNKDGILIERKSVMQGAGLDNLFWMDSEKRKLLVAEHPSSVAFLGHMLFGLDSPSLITMLNLDTGEKTVLYANDGEEISAASGGFVLDKKLFISQVFDNYILACDKSSSGE